MAFGFARVSRDSRPEAPPSGQEAGETLPPLLVEAESEAAFAYEHVHGDTCSCNLRGE
jgi:hypothetical protein